VAAFAEVDKEVVDEDHAEEDEDGCGDAGEGSTPGVGDAEGGGHEGEDEALEGECGAVIEVGAEGEELGGVCVLMGLKVGYDFRDGHVVRDEGGADDAPWGFFNAADVNAAGAVWLASGEVDDFHGFPVFIDDFLAMIEAPLAGGGPPGGAACEPGAFELAIGVFLAQFDVADFFISEVEGEGARVPGAFGVFIAEHETFRHDGACFTFCEGAHDGSAVAFRAWCPVVVGGHAEEGHEECDGEDGGEDLGDAATDSEHGDDFIGAGHFGEGVEDAEEDGGGCHGDEDEGHHVEVEEEDLAEWGAGFLEVFEAVNEVHEHPQGAEGDEAKDGGANEVAQGVADQQLGAGVESEGDGGDDGGEDDHAEFDAITPWGGGFSADGDFQVGEVFFCIPCDAPDGQQNAATPGDAYQAGCVWPGSEDGYVKGDGEKGCGGFDIGEDGLQIEKADEVPVFVHVLPDDELSQHFVIKQAFFMPVQESEDDQGSCCQQAEGGDQVSALADEVPECVGGVGDGFWE
jgi:hypothetical protein